MIQISFLFGEHVVNANELTVCPAAVPSYSKEKLRGQMYVMRTRSEPFDGITCITIVSEVPLYSRSTTFPTFWVVRNISAVWDM